MISGVRGNETLGTANKFKCNVHTYQLCKHAYI